MFARQGIDRNPLLEPLEAVETPALVYDQSRLEALLERGLVAGELAGAKVLYAVKASAVPLVLECFASRLEGFSVSSPFEARLINEHFPRAEVHFTSPGVGPNHISELRARCDFIAFNSQTQAKRYGEALAGAVSLGVRVNTGISNISDPRYDPCRPHSKLGVPVAELRRLLAESAVNLDGLHIHTNSDSIDFGELLDNVQSLFNALPGSYMFKWVNLGGGYLLEDTPLEPLVEVAAQVKAHFGAQVYIEPGAGLVRSAGYLVGSVLDIFEVEGKRVAVLDTTVNHMPEVLEFDYQPGVVGQANDGPFEYVLAGSTCLAGDIFGTYRLPAALKVGEKVVFEEAGAYSLAKAHWFNGTNLPQVGILDHDGRYRVVRTFGYQDFASYWKADD